MGTIHTAKSGFFRRIDAGVGYLLIKTIRLYQKTLSPNHGALSSNPILGCRFYPSCSEYTIRAINERGAVIGSLYGAWRILRCNPLSAGGVDESYKKKK